MITEPFELEKTLHAPITSVWKAITDKDDMKQWYYNFKEFIPKVDFVFQFYGGKERKQYLHICKITEVIVGKKLTYSWRYVCYAGNSFVTFELFEEGNNTRLRLTHKGVESFPINNPDMAKERLAAG